MNTHTRLRLLSVFVSLVLMLGMALPSAAMPVDPPERQPSRPMGVPPALASARGMPIERMRDLRDLRSQLQMRRRALPQSGPAAAPLLGAPGFSLRYEQTFGETEAPYFDDTQHINTPGGMWAGGTALWVGEFYGSRALKYLSDGTFQMQIGTSGNPFALGATELWNVNDVSVDAAGGIWIVDRSCHLAHFDSSGNFLGELGEMWNCSDENDHFNSPSSIAFDSDGNMYVSDTGNYRVQVFESDGSYLATIGVTGEWGSDNNHFDWPRHIAIDASDLLYVADSANHRVQIFNVANPLAITYIATLGVSGEPGTDDSHFDYPEGVAVDATRIYVADSNNQRVPVFDRATRGWQTTMGPGGGNYEYWPTDVAVDGVGHIYIADGYNHRVQQFSDSTHLYTRTFGTSGVPYLTDDEHYNWPSGVAVAGDGSLYVTEVYGQRLIKLTAQGAPLWTVGEPGVPDGDNAHLSWPEDVAVSSGGQAYVADSGSNRIQIFSNGGTYVATLGGDYGTGNYEFKYPMGVAVDSGGNIYVADSDNHRVQVYNASRTYVATLGVTGVPGSDNGHFDWPEDVEVDSAGNIYVADNGNSRVQVFNASRAYVRTLGETGVAGEDFGHFGYPYAVAADTQGRTYVADDWGPRVQVHDTFGQYLTTIAGDWGNRTGDLRIPLGIAVDSAGSVYVADTLNHRIQKLARGTPDWRQGNINGFGSPTETVWALAPFGTTLYAGTATSSGNGAQIWRRSGGTWESVMANGFGDPHNQAIDHLIEFNGAIYASTYDWDDDLGTSDGGEVWRSDNGTSWTRVVDAGFGNADNAEAYRFVIFDSDLYVGTWNGSGTAGADIWRSPSGDLGTWTASMTGGFGNASNIAVMALEPHGGYLYAATYNYSEGAEVWRSSSGDSGTWGSVATLGFGDAANTVISALEVFKGDLYASTLNASGSQVWRCHLCNGTDWEQVVYDGMGNVCNRSMNALEAVRDRLYWISGQSWASSTGLEAWWSSTGDESDWHQIGYAGFGDSNNRAPYWDNSVLAFNDTLVIGTINTAHGGEIWVLLNDLFLPLVMRNYP